MTIKSHKLVARSSSRDERGSGVINSMFGAIVFFAFVLFATQVIIGLYASSTAEAVTADAAHLVASRDDSNTMAVAEANIRQRLSNYKDLDVVWLEADDQVGLRVTATRPSVLPKALASRTKLTTIDRTVWVRQEMLR